MSQLPVIQIENLRFRYPRADRDVLDIDSFSVNEGEKVFIKGASGCGKSTLLSLLGGINIPNAGAVSVHGTSIGELRSSRRDHFRADHIGFIFQMFNLIPYLSVVENVVLPCRFSKSRNNRATKKSSLEEEAIRLLAHLELKGDALLSRKVTELSIGQQQRVAAARALIGAPDLIIADEPTSSLDADVRESFLKLLFAECQQAGSTLVFVSHDASLEKLFDRTVALVEINSAVGAH